MKHQCVDRCRVIAEEQAKGLPCPPVWNSMSHAEQAVWLATEHDWKTMNILHRAVRAMRILVRGE